jgi:peptide-methionine (S)-S-oxide reductase
MSSEGKLEQATLGGGCFWCLEACYQLVDGVISVQPGYSGGQGAEPTYRQVCSGKTGHAEVVRVVFDPARIDYAGILRLFFMMHDPTQLNRQGNDVGTQYRSVIFFTDAEQERIAWEMIRDQDARGAPVVTEVSPLLAFHPAEPEHHNYYLRNAGQPYCQIVVAPKVVKIGQQLAAERR